MVGERKIGLNKHKKLVSEWYCNSWQTLQSHEHCWIVSLQIAEESGYTHYMKMFLQSLQDTTKCERELHLMNLRFVSKIKSYSFHLYTVVPKVHGDIDFRFRICFSTDVRNVYHQLTFLFSWSSLCVSWGDIIKAVEYKAHHLLSRVQSHMRLGDTMINCYLTSLLHINGESVLTLLHVTYLGTVLSRISFLKSFAGLNSIGFSCNSRNDCSRVHCQCYCTLTKIVVQRCLPQSSNP